MRTPTLVRVQSSCLFGESLGAVDCDCGAQLEFSLQLVVQSEGLLVYLDEEGRGAGLRQKTEAISLQQSQGITSTEAYERIGFAPDPRTYLLASEVIKATLGDQASVRLLTNNPSKAQALRREGIRVVEVLPIVPPNLTETARKYLENKEREFGHVITAHGIR